jgi:hypothetical protein
LNHNLKRRANVPVPERALAAGNQSVAAARQSQFTSRRNPKSVRRNYQKPSRFFAGAQSLQVESIAAPTSSWSVILSEIR